MRKIITTPKMINKYMIFFIIDNNEYQKKMCLRYGIT